MGWREQLRKASFRGIPFFVDSSSAAFGRRNVHHEYPSRDKPYTEDMGRKARQFTVEAYVLGDDYLSKRDALISACEQSGKGQLIHPYYGAKFVQVDDCRVDERFSEGRIARISITFVEAGERIFPSSANDLFSKIAKAVENLKSKIESSFQTIYDVLNYPQFVLNSVKDAVRTFSNVLTGIKGNLTGAYSEFFASARQIYDDVDSLIPDGKKLSPSIVASIVKINEISDDPLEVINAYRTPLNFGGTNFGGKNLPGNTTKEKTLVLPVIPSAVVALGGTPSRTQEQKNIKALVSLVKCVTIAQMAPLAAEQSYTSLQDAIAARDEILTVIDQQMESGDVDDEVYQALHEVRKSLSEALPSPNNDVPSLVPYQNLQTRPSLVITYDLYQKLDREADLISRNQVEHPGFVPGGVSLEVIRDT